MTSVTVKADTRRTNGSLTVVELVIAPKSGPALHSHLREDELWYVLEGDFRFKAGDAHAPGIDGRHGLRAAWLRCTVSKTSATRRGGCAL